MIVEGVDDKFAVIQLMKHHTDWTDDKTKVPVHLEYAGDVDQILAASFIPAKLRESGLEVLGVILDADEEFSNRWQRLRKICAQEFEDVPETMPPAGLILQKADLRLGIWIMPNNQDPGMLETFLLQLIKDTDPPPLAYAQEVTKEAKVRRAPYKDAHVKRAEIHSWLAWQDPPGQALGRAITSKTLDPRGPLAAPFIDWFLKLYDLPRKAAPAIVV